MKLSKITKILKGIPYTTEERGKSLYNHIINNRPRRCLELGFAHGVASCYIAAALHEIGNGKLDCVDLPSSKELKPNLEELLERSELSSYVEIHRELNSYNWFLKKEIERNSTDYVCKETYDLCFIDGPKNWTIDGLAFFLVDKLLKQDGYVVFDDYRWRYADYSKEIMDGITLNELSTDQIVTPNIELVFQLLVMQHPDYSKFVIDEDWAWAQKTKADKKTVRVIASQSLQYRLIKALRRLRLKS